MPEWTSPIIAALAVFFGLGVNLVLAGKMVGRVTEGLANLSAAVVTLTGRVDQFEDEVEGEAQLRSSFETRLHAVEKGIDVFWGVRDQLNRMDAAGEVEGRHTREKLDSLARSLSGIERQMATISKEGLGYRPGRDAT